MKKEAVNWVEFADHGRKLPKERRLVLVKIESDVNEGGGVAMGYLRYAAGDKTCPYFVCVAIPGRWKVTHWCDCLPDGFGETVPGWHWAG